MPTGYRAYGKTTADLGGTIDPVTGDYLPGAVTFTVYPTITGGAAITDLLNTALGAVTTITSAANGKIPRFYAPDTLTQAPWLDDGSGDRVQAIPADVLEHEVSSVGIITADSIGDATVIGKALIRTTSQANARTSIGAAATTDLTGFVTCVTPVRIYGIGTTLPAVDGSELNNDLFILRPV